MIRKGYLNENKQPTEKTFDFFPYTPLSPRNAIILAAGFGARMTPINTRIPKGILLVGGEPLIDRLINQLHAVGIDKIIVVVGFMKESYYYLADKYGVDIVFNDDYASKNNLATLAKVADFISNTYVVPCDIWCEENPFKIYESHSWYMISDAFDESSNFKLNGENNELVRAPQKSYGNKMIGISYIMEEDAKLVRTRLKKWECEASHNNDFWERVLYLEDGKMLIRAKKVSASKVIEIDTYEQLRALNADSTQLRSDALDAICNVLMCKTEDIKNINILKKGMTNRSFSFNVYGEKYIMRIPGEGTDQFIDRAKEAEVYCAISGMGFCDAPLYIDSKTGYKITKFLKNVRACNPCDIQDVRKCMEKLRELHEKNIQVEHIFDIFEMINYYERLRKEPHSIYSDYVQTKNNVMQLKLYVNSQIKSCCLTHIDAIPDNFLFYTKLDGIEEVQLTDWEYSGMQDPHVDLAMFIIYSLYDRKQADDLIDVYFKGDCDMKTRAKVYCYISSCGLLWSNWCELKKEAGVEFGDYGIYQYRYAKEYFGYAQELIERVYFNEKA